MTTGPDGLVQVAIPPMLAAVPSNINVVDMTRPDGVITTVLIINSVNGTFGFPIDPEPARAVGRELIASADRAEAPRLITPPSGLIVP
jgi:hypothetical protein